MITSSQLGDFLENCQIGTWVNLPDTQYSLPAEDWLSGSFASGLGSLLGQLGFAWSAEKMDCDDFARFAASYAALLHSKSGNKTGLAFGEFWYTRADGQGHAINVAVIRSGSGELALRFFEPQTQSIVELTKEEIATCEFCRI
jgi:hypothetical protein